MASRAPSMKATTGSGASGSGRVLGVNSGRGAGFIVLGICQSNTLESSAVPGSSGAGIATGRGLTRNAADRPTDKLLVSKPPRGRLGRQREVQRLVCRGA